MHLELRWIYINLKIFLILFIGFLLIVFSSTIIYDNVLSKDENYGIYIENKSYEVVKIENAGTQKIVYFKITIILHNSGDSNSEDITVSIWDEEDELNTIRNGIITAGESRPFIFGDNDDWMVAGLGEHNLNIAFYPTNESQKTQYNSGFDTFVIGTNNENNKDSLPGFEITLAFVAITVFIFYKRKYKK